MSSSIENIEKVLGAKRFGDRSAQIDWILTDSRSLCFPEETLFFALKTKRNDGHKYLPELYERGVRNFVVGELPADMKSFQDANFLQLANPLKGLQKLAEKHREQFQIPVIGITGSNGKTIVKEWLYQLLSPDRVVTRSPRSYNSQIGVPLSVWLMNERTELAIFEAGISEMGEMEALQTIIKPTVGILTNIGGAHQENFFSLQDKCMEKLTLFKDCDVIIYDGDNELISSCVAKSLFTSREIAWSKKDNERPLFIESIQKGEHVTTIKYRYLGMPNEFSIPFIDDASIENSLHCLAVALYMMVSPEQITERMARLEQIAMRLEVKEGKNGCVLINDSYNSDLASLDIALDFMSRRSDDKGKKRTLILSDMLETGQSGKLLYRQVAELVHSRGVEKIIGVGEEIRTAAARFEIEKYFFRTTEELLESDLLAGLRDEVILITDNQAMNLKNDASLKYDTLGSSNIQQYALNTKISQASSVKNEMHQIMVPNGKRADITFSDGTRIYINSGSKVIYPDIFEERKREILVEGEVYLDVAKRKDCPFVVKTREFDIRVLGTSFNVCAYREDEAASVVLVRGSVEVTTENKSKVRLAPNQLVDIKGNKTQVRKVDVSEYISWKDNLLLLHQRPVGDVLKKLERYYGCKIRYDAEITTLSLSGKLDLQTDITNVMDNLCLSLSLHYTINDKDEIYVSLK